MRRSFAITLFIAFGVVALAQFDPNPPATKTILVTKDVGEHLMPLLRSEKINGLTLSTEPQDDKLAITVSGDMNRVRIINEFVRLIDGVRESPPKLDLEAIKKLNKNSFPPKSKSAIPKA